MGDAYDADTEGLGGPFPAVFIRAPAVADAGDCEALVTVQDRPVVVRQGPIVGTAFHPGLTADPRLHRLALLESPAVTP